MSKSVKQPVSATRKKAIVAAVRRRRKKVRRMAVEYKGGACQLCGYNKCPEALDFHHVDRSAKSFGISAKGYTRSWIAIKDELEKCIMVCANCHRELHTGLLQQEAIVSLTK